MKKVVEKSPFPVYICGAVWLIWAIFLPLYRVQHFIFAAVVSFIFYYLSGKYIFKDKITEIETPPIEVSTDDKGIVELAGQGNQLIERIRNLGREIDNRNISSKILSIEQTTTKIFDHVVKNPNKLSQIRKLINYYLPTTVKMLEMYENMEEQDISGENITSTMNKISDAVSKIDVALKSQLDKLYSMEALDISSDITVMENMLAREGFSDIDISKVIKKEKDD